MIDDLIAPSFRLSEFVDSQTAIRAGIDNSPTAEAMGRIRNILAPGMQRVRDLLGHPVVISSGYRSPRLNAMIGGARNSQHVDGLAADFTCPGFGPALAVAHHLLRHQSAIRWDQLIFEGSWVHISFAQGGFQRGGVLTARFLPGGVAYSQGLPPMHGGRDGVA